MWEYLYSLAILVGSGILLIFFPASSFECHMKCHNFLPYTHYDLIWNGSDCFQMNFVSSVTLAMISAIVPKQLAKNVTLILHPRFQVVCRASISAFFSCQRIHCGCNVPAVSCSYYMQTQSLAGKINSEKQLLCTVSQAGSALFLSLLASCFHTLLLQLFI